MDLIDLRARGIRATVPRAIARALGVVVVLGCLLAARFAWADLAGVGLMTNENALRRRRSSAALDRGVVLMATATVPIWLELWPAGTDVVARLPGLGASWELGRGRCWRIWLSDGLGQSFALEAVARHRPGLWRGQRAGSALLG